MSDPVTCTCGRTLELEPTPIKVKLTGIEGAELDGVLMARCECGLVRMKLPELPPEQAAKIRAMLEEGRKPGLSMSYNGGPDARSSGPSSGSPPRRARMGRPVPPAFRPRRKG